MGSTELATEVGGEFVASMCVCMPWVVTYINCILAIRCAYGLQKNFSVKKLPPLAALTDTEIGYEFLNIT